MTKPANPFRYFNSSPDVIRLVVVMYVKFPLSLRNVEDLLADLASGDPGIPRSRGSAALADPDRGRDQAAVNGAQV